VATVLVVVIVAGVIALDIVNRRAEREIARSLEESIERSGMAEYVTYDSIDVQAARGTMTIRGASFVDPYGGVSFEAGEVAISAPPAELVALMQNPETATLARASTAIEDSRISSGAAGTGDLTIDSLDLDVRGQFSQNMGPRPIDVISRADSISLDLDGIVATPPDEMLQQFAMGPDSPLADADNWTIDEFMQPVPNSAKFSVEEIDPQLRAMITEGASMFGAKIPADGSFVFRFEIGDDGMPQITVE
jgi:hypothetical protein